MTDDNGASAFPSLDPGRTTSDSIPFQDSLSGASSGSYPSSTDDEPTLVTHDDRYFCPVCHKLLKDPIQTSCGHRLCKNCVEIFLGPDESKMCPAQEPDCMEVRRDNIYPDPGFRREIKQLLVYCPNKSKGCPQKIKLGVLEKHQAECQYRVVPCAYANRGCKNEVLFMDFERHKKECGYRSVCCDQCGQEFNANQKEEHDANDCPEAPAECQYRCGKKLKRRQLEDHLQSCPKKPSECPYKSLGCTFEGNKEQVKAHAQDINAHFEVLIRFTVKSEEEKRKANEELENLKQAAEENTRKVQALEAQLNTIHRELRLKMMQQVERIMQLEQKTEEIQGNFREIPQVQQLQHSVDQLKGLIPQLANHDRQVASHEIRMAEMDLRFQMLETASYEGRLLWKIRDFSHRKRDAVQGRTVSLYSQPFYAGRFGYKMCARVYLNGDGIGRGTHMSLYFVVMKGEYDALLPWPFQHRVSLILLDQSRNKRHLKDEFHPDPNSTSFRRPENAEMNVASGCPLFVAHTVLDNPTNQYIKDDTLFIKVVVDISNLQTP